MCLNGRWEHGQTPAASGVGPVLDHPVWSHRAPATGRNQSLTPSFQTIPCLILIQKLFYIQGNGTSFIWEGKWYKQSSVIFRICWEEKAFIQSGTSWALQKRSFDKAEKPLMMQKRHLILAETFNKCVMLGWTNFSCDHTARWSVPQWPWVCSIAWATTGHWYWPHSSQKWL